MSLLMIEVPFGIHDAAPTLNFLQNPNNLSTFNSLI